MRRASTSELYGAAFSSIARSISASSSSPLSSAPVMKWRGKRGVYVGARASWRVSPGTSCTAARCRRPGASCSPSSPPRSRGWEWDLALLQEVPPWWPARLAAELGAEQRMVLTSRNAGLRLRRAVAVRWPDADQVKRRWLQRDPGAASGRWITAHRTRRLSLLPERRWVHGVRLAAASGSAICTRPRTQRQVRAPRRRRPAWAGGMPILLGGDFNLRGLALDQFAYAGGHGVDHVFVHGSWPSATSRRSSTAGAVGSCAARWDGHAS